MAVLLVGMGVMAVMMTVAMPVWKQAAQREKEAELVFRGEQYARAIGLFQRKMGPGTLPPTLDVLVDQRFLRKKFKDPITNDDFASVTQLTGVPGQQTGTTQPGGLQPAAPTTGPSFGASGGILGVASKSKDQSLRVYKGRNHYNEWAFVYAAPTQAGGGAQGAGGQGAGGRGTGPGQRGGNGQQAPPTSPFGAPSGREGPGGDRGPAPGRQNGPGGSVFGQPRR